MKNAMSWIDQEKFAAIVRHARATNPFYAHWIPEKGKVPLLDRLTFQKHNERILNGHKVTARTSGSTGIPVKIHMSAERGARDLAGVGLLVRHLGGPLVRTSIVFPSKEPCPADTVPIHTPVAEQLVELRARYVSRGATALITYPSNVELLSREILKQQSDYRFIKRVGLISESIDPGQIALVKQAFPEAQIWSSYSAMETGMISFQCPYEPEYHHAMTEKLGIEILDAEGNECEPGQIGRVVITDYVNREMPLIRYEIGDLAAYAEGICPCGKIPFPALKHILGKVRGCLLHGDGRRVPFISLSAALRDLPGMVRYQVVQQAVDQFIVRVHSEVPLEKEILELFRGEFGAGVEVEMKHEKEISRGANGKFYASICKV
jgi:phenylacetate-CoA ligase